MAQTVCLYQTKKYIRILTHFLPQVPRHFRRGPRVTCFGVLATSDILRARGLAPAGGGTGSGRPAANEGGHVRDRHGAHGPADVVRVRAIRGAVRPGRAVRHLHLRAAGDRVTGRAAAGVLRGPARSEPSDGGARRAWVALDMRDAVRVEVERVG